MKWTTLVSAEDLLAQLNNPELRLVDARFSLAGGDEYAGEQEWRTAHLPGAGYAHLNRDLSNLDRPVNEGRHPLPDAEAFCATLERLGISPDSQVVVYDADDGSMAAARFWWLMRLLGHQRVAVLDGGFAHWTALGLPSNNHPLLVVEGHYSAVYDLRKIAGAEDVKRMLRHPSGWLLDARSPERFRGEVEPLDPVAGHIPGAVNRPHGANIEDGRFRPADVLRREFTAMLDGYMPNEVLLSCGSGVTACHNLLAMEYAGLHGARVYAASWSGWISDPERPVATGK